MNFVRIHASFSTLFLFLFLLRQVGWPTLAWRRRRNKLLFLWDLLNKQGPPDLASDIPKLASERADYSLRGPSLAFPRCLTSQTSESFLPASIELFNSLPASVSSCSSRSSFLFALDRHFSKDTFPLVWPNFHSCLFRFLSSHLPRRSFTLVLTIW